MKKFFATILALVYICTSTGIMVHLHYCMGKPADWGLGHNKSNTCGKCGMEKTDGKDNGCCRDEYKFFKNDTDQKIVESSLQVTEFTETAFLTDYPKLPVVQISSATDQNPLNSAPPGSSGVAVYILNRTFLI
jgi:hypothetical protein